MSLCFATAPPLILVGALMMSEVGKINFVDFSDGLPAFLTIIMMPLTGSIANGFAFGFVSYVFMKTAVGKYKEVSWIMWFAGLHCLCHQPRHEVVRFYKIYPRELVSFFLDKHRPL